ncbi:MAG: CAP domain-containing protein [Acidobacteriota bacterium]|nr:CAP domain-containing protein [Acidobacteriota bacterium]
MNRAASIPALLLAALALPLRAAGGGVSAGTPAEQYLVSAANQERAALGLPPLRRDPALGLAALGHARTMAQHGEIAHQFPGESELAVRASAAGAHFSVVEENVGQAPSTIEIHTLWMHSPHHRDNLLDPSVDSIGVSVVARNGLLYAVEDFARTVQPAGIVQQEIAIAGLVSDRGIAILDTQAGIEAARQTCALASGYAGARRPWFIMRFTSDSLSTLPRELTARIASGRFHQAAIGACAPAGSGPFSSYSLAVLLYP